MKSNLTSVRIHPNIHFSPLATSSKRLVRRGFAAIAWGILLTFAHFVACATSIPLFGTGLSTSGTPLSGGAADPHYAVLQTGGPAVVLSSLWGNWGADD